MPRKFYPDLRKTPKQVISRTSLHSSSPLPRHLHRFNSPAPAMENGNTDAAKDPSGFLSEIIGAPVTVKLNSGVVYKGAN